MELYPLDPKFPRDRHHDPSPGDAVTIIIVLLFTATMVVALLIYADLI